MAFVTNMRYVQQSCMIIFLFVPWNDLILAMVMFKRNWTMISFSMLTIHKTNSRLYLDTIQAWNLSRPWRVRWWDEMRYLTMILRKGRKKLEYILSLYMGDHLFIVSGWNESFMFRDETNALNSGWNSISHRVVNPFQIGMVHHKEVGDYDWYSVSHSGW